MQIDDEDADIRKDKAFSVQQWKQGGCGDHCGNQCHIRMARIEQCDRNEWEKYLFLMHMICKQITRHSHACHCQYKHIRGGLSPHVDTERGRCKHGAEGAHKQHALMRDGLMELDERGEGAPQVCDLVLEEAAGDGEEAAEQGVQTGGTQPREEDEDGEEEDGGENAERVDKRLERTAGQKGQNTGHEQREDRERVVERELLVEHRSREQHRAAHVRAREKGAEREQHQRETRVVVLEMRVVDQDKRRQEEQRHKCGALIRAPRVHMRDNDMQRRKEEKNVREKHGQSHGKPRRSRLMPPRDNRTQRALVEEDKQRGEQHRVIRRQRRIVKPPVRHVVRVPRARRDVGDKRDPVPLRLEVAEQRGRALARVRRQRQQMAQQKRQQRQREQATGGHAQRVGSRRGGRREDVARAHDQPMRTRATPRAPTCATQTACPRAGVDGLMRAIQANGLHIQSTQTRCPGSPPTRACRSHCRDALRVSAGRPGRVRAGGAGERVGEADH